MDSQHTSHPTTYAYSNPHYPEFYDLYIRSLFGSSPSQDSVLFFKALSSIQRTKAGSPGQLVKVIDIGTGTGRVIKDLLSRLQDEDIYGGRVEMVGVDHSSSMLERAKRTMQVQLEAGVGMGEVRWIQAPATSFLAQVPELENEVDVLIFAAGGISHLTADGEVLEFLQQAKRALRKSDGSVAVVSILHEFIPDHEGNGFDTERDEEDEARVLSEEHSGLVYAKSPTRMSWVGDVRTDRFAVKGVRVGEAGEEKVWEQEMVWSLRMFDEKAWERYLRSAGLVIGGVLELEIQRMYFLNLGG
jgi:ubiquinone/menaquinone biosynthesis C-methylase UbiE